MYMATAAVLEQQPDIHQTQCVEVALCVDSAQVQLYGRLSLSMDEQILQKFGITHPTRSLRWALSCCVTAAAVGHVTDRFCTRCLQVVLEGQKVLPTRAQQAGFKFKYTELTDALRNILK